jgi:hypothetical protein
MNGIPCDVPDGQFCGIGSLESALSEVFALGLLEPKSSGAC